VSDRSSTPKGEPVIANHETFEDYHGGDNPASPSATVQSGWTDEELIALARKARLPRYMYDTPSGREALARLLSMQSENALRWNKTSEGHPDGECNVIGIWNGEVGVAHHTYSHRWHNPEDDEDDYRAPEYWMPLPEVPNGK
jgi:hypothetical protein